MSPLIATLISAFTGAVIAQLLSHLLTTQREKRKESLIVYQEFIYPFINDVILYLETETNFRKGHDVERFIDSVELLEGISEKISYGDSNLLYAIVKYNKSITFFDGKGYAEKTNELKVYYWFLNYSKKILKNTKGNMFLIKEISTTQKLYGIWTILTDRFGYETAMEIMSYSWGFSEEFLSDNLLVDVEENFLKDNVQTNLYFLNKLNFEFESIDYLPDELIQIIKNEISSLTDLELME